MNHFLCISYFRNGQISTLTVEYMNEKNKAQSNVNFLGRCKGLQEKQTLKMLLVSEPENSVVNLPLREELVWLAVLWLASTWRQIKPDDLEGKRGSGQVMRHLWSVSENLKTELVARLCGFWGKWFLSQDYQKSTSL